MDQPRATHGESDGGAFPDRDHPIPHEEASQVAHADGPRAGDARGTFAFVARFVALTLFVVSACITIIEDPKEVAKQIARSEAGNRRVTTTPPPGHLHFGATLVVDTRTHLEWQREATPTRLDWGAAKSHCASLTIPGAGTGFRLPSRDELMSVLSDVDDPFGGVLDWYWSSSPSVREGTAWAVGASAWLNGNPVTTKSRVRCVRDSTATFDDSASRREER